MELKVKTKVVDGKNVKGIINENLKEIAEFIYADIYEFQPNKYSEHKYFICKMEDGSCSLYDYNGVCRISYKDGYEIEKILKFRMIDSYYNNGFIDVVAKKNNEIGILEAKFDYKNNNKPIVEISYDFGKCDEVKEYDDGTVQLIKHTKRKDRVGYYYHKNIGEIIEPKFLSYAYYTIACKRVGLYSFKDGNGDERCDSYRLSDHIEYDKLTLNVEMIEYSKLKNKNKVVGLKQKVYDSKESGYHPSFKFEDFIPAIYSNISYDEKKQIFFLEQTINGQLKKGFMGVTFDWHFDGKGWWIWGYPNLKTEVNVPCEYEDIKIIEGNYALLKKDGKYGLIKFSFGKSNGDWDCFNRKNEANGKCYEVAPCIYDSIEKVGNNFVGFTQEEAKIITDCRDEETKKYVTVGNDYKRVNSLSDNIYLCELKSGKKEVLILHKYYKWEYQSEYNCTINKISPCNDAVVLNNNENSSYCLIKTVNNNIISIYCKDNKGNIELIEENILDITYDETSKYYIISKTNGHIILVNDYGEKEFSTEALEIEPKDLSVTYLSAIGMFKVVNNNIIKMYRSKNKPGNQVYENRIFKSFDGLQSYYNLFVAYIEQIENEVVTKLARVNTVNDEKGYKMQEIELLKGNFQVENIVLNGKRIIFSTIDSKTHSKRYGVIESEEGNICIECTYEDIQFDSNNKMFICKKDEGEILFDSDGYLFENPSSYRRTYDPKLTLNIESI